MQNNWKWKSRIFCNSKKMEVNRKKSYLVWFRQHSIFWITTLIWLLKRRTNCGNWWWKRPQYTVPRMMHWQWRFTRIYPSKHGSIGKQYHKNQKNEAPSLDYCPLSWYNTRNYSWEGAFSMPEQRKKTPCGIGLMAHVRASRRAPHLKASSPVQKPGIFHALRQWNYFYGQKYHHMLWFRKAGNRSIWWLIFNIWLCSHFQRRERGSHRQKHFCRLQRRITQCRVNLSPNNHSLRRSQVHIIDDRPVEDSTTKHYRPERKKHHGQSMSGM